MLILKVDIWIMFAKSFCFYVAMAAKSNLPNFRLSSIEINIHHIII